MAISLGIYPIEGGSEGGEGGSSSAMLCHALPMGWGATFPRCCWHLGVCHWRSWKNTSMAPPWTWDELPRPGKRRGRRWALKTKGSFRVIPWLSHVIPLALAVEGGAVPVSLECLDSGNDTLLNPFGICYGWLALALSSVFWISSGSSSLHLFLKIRMISSLWQHTPQSVSERLSKLHQSTRCVQIPSGWHWQVDEILAKDVEAKPSNLGTFIDFSEPGFEELVVHQSNGVVGCYRGQWVGWTAFQAEVENIDNFDKYVN